MKKEKELILDPEVTINELNYSVEIYFGSVNMKDCRMTYVRMRNGVC